MTNSIHFPRLAVVLLMLLGSAVTACEPTRENVTDDQQRNPAIDVSPDSGAVGAMVTVEARGFYGNETVVLGFGPPQSEYEILHRVQTDDDGAVSTTAVVPDWASPGQQYVWVVATPDNRARVVSDAYTITFAQQTPPPEPRQGHPE